MTCTCGAKSVSSNLHSTWCDVFTTLFHEGFHWLQSKAQEYPGTKYMYVATEYRDFTRVWEDFRAQYERDITCTLSSMDYNSVVFRNDSEVFFTSHRKIEMFERFQVSGAVIENCEYAGRIIIPDCNEVRFLDIKSRKLV